MKLKYYSETDFLYIDLSEKPSVDSQEIVESVVVDLDCWALECIYQFLESHPASQKMKKIYQKVEKLW